MTRWVPASHARTKPTASDWALGSKLMILEPFAVGSFRYLCIKSDDQSGDSRIVPIDLATWRAAKIKYITRLAKRHWQRELVAERSPLDTKAVEVVRLSKLFL